MILLAAAWLLVVQSWTGQDNRPVPIARYSTGKSCSDAMIAATADRNQSGLRVYAACIPVDE